MSIEPNPDPLAVAEQLADQSAAHAAPAIAVTPGGTLATPDHYPVAVSPRRDYRAALPANLAEQVAALDTPDLGVGDSGAGVAARPPRRRAREDDGEALTPDDAIRMGVAATLALLVDETAADLVLDAANPMTRQVWAKRSKRTPEFEGESVSFAAYTVVADRVVGPSRGNGWPRGTALDFWTETVIPAVDRLDGVAKMEYGRGTTRPAVTLTNKHRQHVRDGVATACDHVPALWQALSGSDLAPDADREVV